MGQLYLCQRKLQDPPVLAALCMLLGPTNLLLLALTVSLACVCVWGGGELFYFLAKMVPEVKGFGLRNLLILKFFETGCSGPHL